MELQKKFKQWLNTKPNETLRDIQCEIIADNHAIEFVEWVNRHSDDDFTYGKFKNKTYQQILLMFKIEKGL